MKSFRFSYSLDDIYHSLKEHADASAALELLFARFDSWLNRHLDKSKLIPLKVKQSCAVTNFVCHSQELLKNSIDAVIKGYQNHMARGLILDIKLELDYNEESVTVVFSDNGCGFEKLKRGELKLAGDVRDLLEEGLSVKHKDEMKLGGMGKGLRLLASSMNSEENAGMRYGNAREGGAQIILHSTLKPYKLKASAETAWISPSKPEGFALAPAPTRDGGGHMCFFKKDSGTQKKMVRGSGHHKFDSEPAKF